MQPSYLDFLFHGVSFASNAYSYQEDKKPWLLEESLLNKIREVWFKNFLASAGLSLISDVASIFCLSVIVSPNLATVAFIAFIALSIFFIVRVCEASQQSLLWDKRFCDIRKRMEDIENRLQSLKN